MIISSHEQLAAAIHKDLMMMSDIGRSEWLEIISLAIDGELDSIVEYWVEAAKPAGFNEDYVRSLVSEIADYIKSSDEYDEICKIAEYDEDLDDLSDED